MVNYYYSDDEDNSPAHGSSHMCTPQSHTDVQSHTHNVHTQSSYIHTTVVTHHNSSHAIVHHTMQLSSHIHSRKYYSQSNTYTVNHTTHSNTHTQ